MKAESRQRNWRWVSLVLALVTCAVLVSCSSGPPKELKETANALPDRISESRAKVDKAKAEFDQKLGEAKYDFIRSYTREQQHADRFEQAATKLSEADTAYNDRVKGLLDGYQESEQADLEKAIADVNNLRTEAESIAAQPAQWLDRVVATKANPNEVVNKASTAANSVVNGYDTLSKDAGIIRDRYTNQAEKIGTLVQPFKDANDVSAATLIMLNDETKKPTPNYALMTDYGETIAARQDFFAREEPALRGKFAELPVKETHTLLDIRVDTALSISRTSWQEAYDFPDEHDYDYPERQVDQNTAAYFAQFGPDFVLARQSGNNFGMENGTDSGQWDKLGIDPHENWPSDDSDGEFSVGEMEDTFCNKVRVLVDGKPSTARRPDPAQNYCSKYDVEADVANGIYWLESDELDSESIGMDIYSKGAGDFNDQAAEEASPPGMVYVGDSSMGEWKTDNNGNSFWVFYGQYRFFSDLIGGPTPYHYRSEYDDWNRNYRYAAVPYYAGASGSPRYGARSPLVSSRFPNSSYAAAGLADATVRNAGPVARSGGPGGGGK